MQRSRQVGMAVVTVLALTGALTIATTTAASATPPGLSSISAINTYLADNGITNAFWETGLKNYAGPSCPGTDWNCHAANVPIVQFAALPGSTNLYLCVSPNCLVIQVVTAGGQNGGACLRGDGSADVVQVCEINQFNTGNPNNTNAAGIQQNSQQNQAVATARQVARITQENGSGSNIAHIQQVIGQTSNLSRGSTTIQSQEAHQAGTVDQMTESGSNTSNIDQSQKQSQKASRVAGLASQKQNTIGNNTGFTCDRPEDDPTFDQQKNQCTEVVQNSSLVPTVGGVEHSNLKQVINESQTVSGAGSLDQDQGQPSGLNGQDGTPVVQNSSAPVDSLATQDTVQAQTATGVVVNFGDQFKNTGDPRCCQNQTDNLNSTADITQTTNQSASSDNAIQEAIFDGHCLSSGTCHVLQSATIDGSTDTNECPAPGDPPTGSCNEFRVCSEVSTEGGGTETQCFTD